MTIRFLFWFIPNSSGPYFSALFSCSKYWGIWNVLKPDMSLYLWVLFTWLLQPGCSELTSLMTNPYIFLGNMLLPYPPERLFYRIFHSDHLPQSPEHFTHSIATVLLSLTWYQFAKHFIHLCISSPEKVSYTWHLNTVECMSEWMSAERRRLREVYMFQSGPCFLLTNLKRPVSWGRSLQSSA